MAIPAWADKQFEKLLQAAINGDLALLEVEVSGRPRYAAALRLPISETTTAYTHLALMLHENGGVEGLPFLVLNLDQREVSGLTKILKYVREHPDEFNDEDIEWTALFLESAIRIQLMPGVS